MVGVIAEAGIAHNGVLKTAIDLASAAKNAGADAVKFQTYSPDLMLRRGPDYDLLSKAALSRNSFILLAKRCEEIGIEFMSTPGDLDSLRFLVEEVGVKRIKIGSDDLTYAPLVQSAYATGLPLILSTGMATLTEVADAIHGFDDERITLLHCISAYPCRLEDVNLAVMSDLGRAKWIVHRHPSRIRVGYSDHTPGIYACIAATARDAVMVEKHFMLTEYDDCPDKAVSVSEKHLKIMISAIRQVEKMTGNGVKAPCEEELRNIPLLRKGTDGRRGLVT